MNILFVCSGNTCRSAMAEGNVMTEYEMKFAGEGKPICKLIASNPQP